MSDLNSTRVDESVEVRLSAQGEARRAAMLRVLDGAMRRRNIGRAAGRASAAIAGVAGAVAIAWVGMAPRTAPPPPVAEAIGSRPMVAMIATDPTILDRLAVPAGELSARTITDSQLRILLADLGVPTGFIRTGGRVILANDIGPKDGEPNNDSSS